MKYRTLMVKDCHPVSDTFYAQTNLQLYNQLRNSGRSDADIVAVDRAYRMAVTLFTGQFRSSGKPFLAHLVGTASILADVDARSGMVVAGLTHASYAQGEWGDGARAVTGRRRRRLVDGLGPEAAGLVERYTTFVWNERTIPELCQRAGSLSPEEIDMVVLRLANVLEDYLDLGMAYSRKGVRAKHGDPVLDATVELAEAVAPSRLSGALKRAFDENRLADLPPEVQRPDDRSFTLAPLSHHLRPSVVAVRAARRGRTKVLRAIRSRLSPS